MTRLLLQQSIGASTTQVQLQTVLLNEYESYMRDGKDGSTSSERTPWGTPEACLRINYRLTNVHQEDDGLVDAARA